MAGWGSRQAVVTTAGGTIAGASLTGTYATVLAATGKVYMLSLANSCDQDIVISLDGGTTDWITLPARTSIQFDFAANGLSFSGTVQAKHNGVVPGSGRISVAIIKAV